MTSGEYILKGTNFDLYDSQYIKKIQHKINKRPREKLNFQTPVKLFYASLN
jgi:IS30 family transposase